MCSSNDTKVFAAESMNKREDASCELPVVERKLNVRTWNSIATDEVWFH